MRSLARRSVLIATVAITAAVVASDWPLGILSRFWRDHSLLGGVASGLVLLFVGFAVVERWLERQEVARWQRVAETAFQDLADALLRTYRLLILASDGRSHGMDVIDGPPTEVEHLVEEAYGAAEWPGRCDRSVALLSRDAEWCRVAYPFLRGVEEDQRIAIGRWAPTMVQSGRFAETLAEVSEVNRTVRDLRGPIRYPSREGRGLSEDEATAFGGQWIECVKAVLEVREALRIERSRSMGEPTPVRSRQLSKIYDNMT